jgi:hypothetical protein
MHVALTLALDWDKELSDPEVSKLFTSTDVDTFGRTHPQGTKCWIIQATTKMFPRQFMHKLFSVVDHSRILYLSISQE